MNKFMHLFLILAMFGFSVAEAVELPVPAHSGETETQLHEHHSDNGIDAQETEGQHCTQCCHAPCAWVYSTGLTLIAETPALSVRIIYTDKTISRDDPPLLRPPIS